MTAFGTLAAPTIMRRDTASPPAPLRGGVGGGVLTALTPPLSYSRRSPSPPFPKEGSGVVCQRCPNLFTVPKGRQSTGRGKAPATGAPNTFSPEGTAESAYMFCRPFGTFLLYRSFTGVKTPACIPSSLRDFGWWKDSVIQGRCPCLYSVVPSGLLLRQPLCAGIPSLPPPL